MLPYLNTFFAAINPQNNWRIGSKEKMLEALEFDSYANNDFIIRTGKAVNKFYWIAQGSVRQYFHTEKDVSRIVDIFIPGEFFTDHDCHFNKGLATMDFTAIGSVDCVSIDMDKICHLYTDVPEFAGLVMQLLVRMNSRSLARVKTLLNFSQQERYKYICDNQPELLQLVPLKYIAQYIGIAPESLSRLRSLK